MLLTIEIITTGLKLTQKKHLKTNCYEQSSITEVNGCEQGIKQNSLFKLETELLNEQKKT